MELSGMKKKLESDRKILDDKIALYNLEERKTEFERMMSKERKQLLEELDSEKYVYKYDLKIQYEDKSSRLKKEYEDLSSKLKKEYENKISKLEEDYQNKMTKCEEMKRQLQKEKHFVNNQQMLNEKRIKLNVGGQHFTTTLTTLQSYPNSMLAAMFSGRFSLKLDEDGEYFIDRNGKIFEIILDWLRTGMPPTITDPLLRKKVAVESSYYGLEYRDNNIQNLD